MSGRINLGQSTLGTIAEDYISCVLATSIGVETENSMLRAG